MLPESLLTSGGQFLLAVGLLTVLLVGDLISSPPLPVDRTPANDDDAVLPHGLKGR